MGGIKIIQLEHLTVELKVTCLRRLIQNNIPWIELFKHQIIKDTNKLLYLSSQFALSVIKKITNKFWIDVLKAWNISHKEKPVLTNEHILSGPLWYNAQLSTKVTYFPKWFKKGIMVVSDVLDPVDTFYRLRI